MLDWYGCIRKALLPSIIIIPKLYCYGWSRDGSSTLRPSFRLLRQLSVNVLHVSMSGQSEM